MGRLRFIHKKGDACILKSPSPQRLIEYALASSSSPASEDQRDKLIGLCADVLRNEEANEKLTATDHVLKEFLALLELNKPANELQLALTKIVVLPQEPKPRN